jgi:hypothetical protein
VEKKQEYQSCDLVEFMGTDESKQYIWHLFALWYYFGLEEDLSGRVSETVHLVD